MRMVERNAPLPYELDLHRNSNLEPNNVGFSTQQQNTSSRYKEHHWALIKPILCTNHYHGALYRHTYCTQLHMQSGLGNVANMPTIGLLIGPQGMQKYMFVD